jgi:hypothetical protein
METHDNPHVTHTYGYLCIPIRCELMMRSIPVHDITHRTVVYICQGIEVCTLGDDRYPDSTVHRSYMVLLGSPLEIREMEQ